MKILLIFLLFQNILIAQSETKKTNTYPFQREVYNEYSSTLLKEVYEKSVKDQDSFKIIAKNKLIEGVDLEKALMKNPSYLKKIDSIVSNPNEINSRLAYNLGIQVKIDGVNISSYDTSTNYNWYKKTLKDEELKIDKNTRFQYDFGDFVSFPKQSIIPNLGLNYVINTLVDGEYVMYYKPIFDKKSNTFRKEVPYCFFTLKDHMMEGSAIYLTPNNDTLAVGKFSENKQTGIWKFNFPILINKFTLLTEYGFLDSDNTLKNNMQNWCHYDIEFLNGEMNGLFSYFENNVLRCQGVLDNNKPVKQWKIFHPNSKLANSFYLLDTPCKLDNKIILPSVNTNVEVINERNLTEILPFGNVTIPLIGLTYSLLDVYQPNTNNDNMMSVGDFSLELFSSFENVIAYQNNFEAYYENGAVYFQLKINEKNKIVYFSNVYDKEGNIIGIWEFNKKQTKATISYYRKNGDLDKYTFSKKQKYKQIKN